MPGASAMAGLRGDGQLMTVDWALSIGLGIDTSAFCLTSAERALLRAEADVDRSCAE
jgi:hypothetical protein